MTDEKKRERAAMINAFYWRRWKRLLSYGLTITEAFEIHRRGKENRLDPEEWKRRMLELQAEWARKDAEEEKTTRQNAPSHDIIKRANPHVDWVPPEEIADWVSINEANVPVGEGGELLGEAGEQIEESSSGGRKKGFPRGPLTARQVIKFLTDNGFRFKRQAKGSHMIYVNDEGRQVTVPDHGSRSLKPGTLSDIKRHAGYDDD